MSIFKPATLSWPARIGAVAVVAAAGLVAVPGVSSAAAIAVTSVPATGAAGNWIQLNSPTPFTFRDAGNVLKVNNNGTTINPWAVQFSSTACATAAAAIPGGTHTIPDVVTSAAGTAVTSASGGFLPGTASATTDLGKVITGTGIPVGTTLATVTDAGNAVLSSGTNVAAGTTAAAIGAAGGPYWAQQVIAVSGTKLSVKAPAYLPPLANSAAYNICVYDVGAGSANQVLATSSFKAFSPPTLISVSSTAGPSMGGNQVTYTGTGFSANTKAYIGGVPLNNQTVNTTAQTVTGTAPAGQGAANITLVSDGGTVGYGSVYTYQDGLLVSPNMTPQGGSAILDVFGTGFQAVPLNFADYAVTATGQTIASSVAATDVLTTSAAHGLVAGDRVRLGTSTIGGLNSGGTYWVKTGSASVLTLSVVPGGPAVDITGATGTVTALYKVNTPGAAFLPTVSFANTGDLITSTAHGLSNGDVVRFTGLDPLTLISNNTPYYVVTAGTNDFQIALSANGTPIPIAADDASVTGWRGADSNTHVVLALGSYDDDATPGTRGAPVAECTGVTVFSDSELICNLNTPNLADGSYQVVLLDDTRTGTARATIATSVSSFTSAAY